MTAWRWMAGHPREVWLVGMLLAMWVGGGETSCDYPD